MIDQTRQGNRERAINFVFMARWNHRLSMEAVQKALRRLYGCHHVLVYGNHARKNPKPGSSYPVDESVQCNADSWKQTAEAEMAAVFPAQGPYVRVHLLQTENQTDMLVVFDHQVCDGMSGILFLRDLWFLLNHPSETLPVLPLQPPVWEIIPEKAAKSIWGNLRVVFFLRYLDFIARKNGGKMNRLTPQYRVDAFELDAELSQAFIQRCKKESTSVHAAICTAWMLAQQSQLNLRNGESEMQANGIRSVSSPVSLRGLLPDEQRTCAGMYYSTVKTRLDCNASRAFWGSARQVKAQIDHLCTKPALFDMSLFFKAMYERQSALPERQKSRVPDLPVDYDFSISNVGRLDSYFISEKEKQLHQIEAVFGPVVNAFEGEKTVGVSTIGGVIRFVFTTFQGDLDTSQIESLFANVYALLKIACDPVIENMETLWRE